MIRAIITIVAATLILDASFAEKAHVPKPQDEAYQGLMHDAAQQGYWPCPFWRYQQIGQPVMYYSLADPNASVDDLCMAEAKREGRE